MTPLSAEVEAALERSDDIVKRGLSLNAAVYSTLAAEVRRLHACLEKSNSNHEHFEREWYLRGDEIERLHARVRELEDEVAVWQHEYDERK